MGMSAYTTSPNYCCDSVNFTGQSAVNPPWVVFKGWCMQL